MDGIRCRVVFNVVTDGFDFTFLERRGGKTQFVLRPDGKGQWTRHPIEDGARTEPTLTFGEEAGREVLQSLAEQLAQLGFVQLHGQPQIAAMKEHLDDLRTQATRLFELAKA